MKRRPSGDGTLFKRADGLWVGGVELPPGPDGKRRIKRVTSKSRNEVLRKLRELRGEVAAGRIPASSSTTVTAWLTYWQDDILPTRPVKAGTVYSYRLTIRRYILPYIGNKRLDKLTPADLRSLYAELTNKISGRAAQKADQILRLALKAAIRDGVIIANVMDRVDKPTHRAKPAHVFNAATAMHIIRTAEQTQGQMWGARWAFGFLTGARESEVLGLEWDRVDLNRKFVDISWQLQRLPCKHGCGEPVNGVYPCGLGRPSYCPLTQWDIPLSMEYRRCSGTLCWTRPKTKAGRRLIPLVDPLVDILHNLDGETLVFHLGGKPIDQERDQKSWKQLLVDAEVPHAPQHSIRHSTATLLMEAGVDGHVVQSVIGHSDIITTRGYQHVDLELARRGWANLEGLLPPRR